MVKALFTLFTLAMLLYLFVALPRRLKAGSAARTRLIMFLGMVLLLVLTILKFIV